MSRLLLVIDMQEGFRFSNVERIIPNILALCDKFEDIYFSCFINEIGSQFEKELNWKSFQNKSDQEILSELKEIPHKKLYHKTLSVLNEKLLNYIKTNKIDTVHIAGIYLDVSVCKFCMDCFDKEISIKLHSDCCTSQDSNNDTALTESLSRVIGKENIINESFI